MTLHLFNWRMDERVDISHTQPLRFQLRSHSACSSNTYDSGPSAGSRTWYRFPRCGSAPAPRRGPASPPGVEQPSIAGFDGEQDQLTDGDNGAVVIARPALNITHLTRPLPPAESPTNFQWRQRSPRSRGTLWSPRRHEPPPCTVQDGRYGSRHEIWFAKNSGCRRLVCC